MADKYGENFDVTLETDSSVGKPSEGIHLADCTKAEVSDNKAKDSKNLVLDFEIAEGDEAGRRARMWLSFKESVRWKMTETLQAFGVDMKPDKSGTPKARITPKSFVGKRVRIHITHDDVSGETRANIERVLPAEGATGVKPQASNPEAEGEAEDAKVESGLPF